jgi:hypothetical protein
MRQMREYKREKTTVEAQLSELESQSKHHDDHLRTLDTWFDQVSTRHTLGTRLVLTIASWSTRSRC